MLTNFDRVREKTSQLYTAVIRKEDGTGIPGSELTYLHLTLYDDSTGMFINGRNDQDVLQAHGVTVDSAGNLAWRMDPDDNVIVGSSKSVEKHIALFVFKYNGGISGGNHERYFIVRNVRFIS